LAGAVIGAGPTWHLASASYAWPSNLRATPTHNKNRISAAAVGDIYSIQNEYSAGSADSEFCQAPGGQQQNQSQPASSRCLVIWRDHGRRQSRWRYASSHGWPCRRSHRSGRHWVPSVTYALTAIAATALLIKTHQTHGRDGCRWRDCCKTKPRVIRGRALLPVGTCISRYYNIIYIERLISK
jgi:hypothetical protein